MVCHACNHFLFVWIMSYGGIENAFDMYVADTKHSCVTGYDGNILLLRICTMQQTMQYSNKQTTVFLNDTDYITQYCWSILLLQ